MAIKSAKPSVKEIPVTVVKTEEKENPKYKGLKVVDITDYRVKKIYSRLRKFRKTARNIFVIVETKDGEVKLFHNMTHGDALWYFEKYKSKLMKRSLEDECS